LSIGPFHDQVATLPVPIVGVDPPTDPGLAIRDELGAAVVLPDARTLVTAELKLGEAGSSVTTSTSVAADALAGRVSLK
jgi:hypothetical protein